MNNTYLDRVLETTNLLGTIPSDADGPYPWHRCHGRRCPHRLRDSQVCVCAAAAWTHCLVAEPRSHTLEHTLRDLERGHARLRDLSSGATIPIAHTIHRCRVVVLVAAPVTANSAVYGALDAYADESGALHDLSSGSSGWRMLDPDDLSRVAATASAPKLSKRERRRAAFADARKVPVVTYIRARTSVPIDRDYIAGAEETSRAFTDSSGS